MTILFSILSRIERYAALLQGKGWGSASIKHEVNSVQKFSQNTAELAIDIGGNIGKYSESLRMHYPSVEIHIFEPSSTNTQILRQKFNSDQLISINPQALSDNTEWTYLYSNKPGSGLGSLTKRRLEHFGLEFNHNEKIETIKFEDYWISVLKSRIIDIVKIDVEGHELNVLKGFGQALDSVKVIQFEFGGCNIDTKTYFQDFWYFFSKKNFKLFRITPLGTQCINSYNEIDEFFSTTNFLAVNQTYLT